VRRDGAELGRPRQVPLLSEDEAPERASIPATTRRDVAATFVVVGASLLAVFFALYAPGERVPERCVGLFDHYVDLTLRDADSHADRAELVADARRSDDARRALARCRTSLTDRQASCAAEADNADAFERCFP
jgi:hypothetical protein